MRSRDEVLQEFELDQFWVDGANIHSMADEIVRLREQLAEKTNSYRSSVIAAEAETKQWKEFFYAERHRAERAERVVEALKKPCDEMLLSVKRDMEGAWPLTSLSIRADWYSTAIESALEYAEAQP